MAKRTITAGVAAGLLALAMAAAVQAFTVRLGSPSAPGVMHPSSTMPSPNANPAGMSGQDHGCDAHLSYGGVTMKILSTRISDRPLFKHPNMFNAVDTGIRVYWVLEYEIVNPNGPTKYGDESINIRSFVPSGQMWQRLDDPDDEPGKIYPAGVAKRGRLIYFSFTDGVPPGLYVDFQSVISVPGSREEFDGWRRNSVRWKYRFIPISCGSSPDATPAALPPPTSAAIDSVTLAVPLQRNLTPKDLTPAAPSVSASYAAQVAIIWTLGIGVLPDFNQGEAWYREAFRRQIQRKEFGTENQIKEAFRLYQIRSVPGLLQLGLHQMQIGEWKMAQFYFGRAAALGDIQGMAALGGVYGYGLDDPQGMVFWCQTAFKAWRKSQNAFEIDAINHFCPLASIAPLMTRAESAANPKSVARARDISAEVQRGEEQKRNLVIGIARMMGPDSKPDPGRYPQIKNDYDRDGHYVGHHFE